VRRDKINAGGGRSNRTNSAKWAPNEREGRISHGATSRRPTDGREL
jgi:hypothetical protein